MNYKNKYVKYKQKYIELKNQFGGNSYTLIGPVNFVYFYNIIEHKSIILMGDFHDSFSYDTTNCNATKIQDKILEFHNIVLEIRNKLFYSDH